MNVKLLARPLAATMLFAAFAYPQAETKAPDDNRAAAADEATLEANRQARVALKPDAGQSPAQTMKQAIAFERYKELAAQREARKEGNSGADRSIEKPQAAKAKPAKDK